MAWDESDRSCVRLVKIEKGNTEFNTIATAMGWSSGDELFEDLIDYGLKDEIEVGGYLAGDEVGSRASGRGLKVMDDVDVFVCYGDPTRWDILNVTSMCDNKGKLWVRSKDAYEF